MAAQAVEKLAIVADQQTDSAVGAKGSNQSIPCLAIDVIGGFVQRQQLRAKPQRGRDLGTLSFPVAQG